MKIPENTINMFKESKLNEHLLKTPEGDLIYNVIKLASIDLRKNNEKNRESAKEFFESETFHEYLSLLRITEGK